MEGEVNISPIDKALDDISYSEYDTLSKEFNENILNISNK